MPCRTRRWLFVVLLPLLALVLAGAAGAARAAPVTVTVTFILVNDIYQMADAPGPDGRLRGGFARLAAVVKAERAKGGHVVFAHAGDTLSPSLMSGLDRGAHIVALTNMIAPDIFVPGNHEFDFGKATFLQRMDEARFPLYAANLRGPDGAPLPHFHDRGVLTIEGVRIGLTGATYDDAARTSLPEDLRFAPLVDTTRAQGEALRREGADLVVAVVHADRRQDHEIVATGAIDIVLSGHDHDLLVNYDGRTVLAESSYDAHYVTLVDVTIDVSERDGRRSVAWWPRFRIVDTATVTPDPEVAATVARYGEVLDHDMGLPLAVTHTALDSRNATLRTRESSMGDLVADAMRVAARADVALMNGGGIRGGKVYPPGSTLTRRDVITELPFNNRLVILEVKGRALRQAIENGLSLLPNASGRFPQVSGMTVDADPRRSPGQRVTAIRVGGAPLDEDRIYRLATNDFLARGGDGYAAFARAPHLLPDKDAPLLAYAVMDDLQRRKTIDLDGPPRIVFAP